MHDSSKVMHDSSKLMHDSSKVMHDSSKLMHDSSKLMHDSSKLMHDSSKLMHDSNSGKCMHDDAALEITVELLAMPTLTRCKLNSDKIPGHYIFNWVVK